MGLTLDNIVEKQFKTDENGAYNQTEVDDFLDEILAEMETREKTTNELQKQIIALTEQIATLKEELAEAKQAAVDVISNDMPSQEQANTPEEETLGANLTQNQDTNTDSSGDPEEETVAEDIVEKYLNENKLALHNQLLDSLGLYEYEKEYAPETFSNWDAIRKGYSYREEENGIVRYYNRGAKTYPQITDEEYEKLLKILKEKDRIKEIENKTKAPMPTKPAERKPFKFAITADGTTTDSFASNTLRTLSIIIWLVGLFVSMYLSVENTRYGVEVNWQTLFFWITIYFISGLMCRCMADVSSDIHVIASSITRFHANEDTSEDKKTISY